MTRGNDAGWLDTKYIVMVSAHTIGGLYKLNNTYLFNNQQPVQGVAINHDHALVAAQLRLQDIAPLKLCVISDAGVDAQVDYLAQGQGRGVGEAEAHDACVVGCRIGDDGPGGPNE